MTNTRVRINGRLNIAEEKISKLKDIAVEIINKTGGKNELSISDLWDCLKHPDVHVFRNKEGQRQKGI